MSATGVPYRVLVLKSGATDMDPPIVVSRGELDYAKPRSLVGHKLAAAPVGATVTLMGITYEKADPDGG